ncbi:MAG: hypothetical protein H6641_07175 [Caldilineaceae bacterium]|nr:hypothetical protein [Caldilineaceae bacterium]
MRSQRTLFVLFPLFVFLGGLTSMAGRAATPPIVTLVSPTQTAIYTVGDLIALEAAVVDAENAIARVEFYIDNALLGVRIEPPWQLSWTSAQAGAHQVQAIAIDALGNRTASPAVDFVVLRRQTADEPYPPSPLILDLHWSPVSTIEQFAQDSDNWTLTWADDDRLYTGYGDGRGWEPKIEQKVSMGYVAIAGAPGNMRGVNVRSPDEQPYGAGAEGRKASGMLMVDGVLYMWARNVAARGQGCQLAWSTDHAQNWQWSSWLFPNFGYCAFVNFGPNYAGARDGYVYMVTPDGPSAYVAYPSFVLTRVPKAQIANRAAYEFLQARDAQNNPIWTADMNQRGAVFTTVGKKAGRSSMSYNAALGRYIWWQGINEAAADERFGGGFGIYDAPEPWGPWTTVYYTALWDYPPGVLGSFPTKWMRADGRAMYLVSDANDSFAVRGVTLTTFHALLPGNPPPTATEAPTAVATLPTPSAPPMPATPLAPCAGDAYYLAQDGQVIIEAEAYAARAAGGGNAAAHSWEPVTAYGSYSGASAMQALPNLDVNTRLDTGGPELQYSIKFGQAGDYYVAVRGLAPADGDAGRNDSIHLGLNGVPITTQGGTGLTGFAAYGAYSWQKMANGAPVIVHIPAAGFYTLNLWMREDGVVVDKLWLSMDANAVSNGDANPGPPAPSCISVNATDTPLPMPTQAATTVPTSTVPSSTPTILPAPTATFTAMPTFTHTSTPTATSTPTSTPTFTHTPTSTPTVTFTFTPTPTTSNTSTPTKVAAACGDATSFFQAGVSGVIMEAEHAQSMLDGQGSAAGHHWQRSNDYAGYAGAGAMIALPNSDLNTRLETNGPALTWRVNFAQAGDYYVYVRGLAPADGDPDRNDSMHVGLNGMAVTTASGTGLTGYQTVDGFSWQSRANGGAPTVLHVPTPGRHTVHLWMREDGVVADKLWLSMTAGAIADGDTSMGPAESACGTDGG